MSTHKKFDLWAIDELKVLVCVLLVIHHVIGDPNTSLKLDYPNGWRIFTDALKDLRMPAFAFISGLLYAWRPVQAGNLKQFLQGKIGRIYVPAMFSAWAFWLLSIAVLKQDVEWAGFFRPLIFSYVHYWYVLAIIVILFFAGTLDALRLKWWPYLLLPCTVWLFLSEHIAGVPLFSLSGAVYLAPFFIFGVICCRAKALINQYQFALTVLLLILAAGCITLLLQEFSLHKQFLENKRDWLGLIAGCTFPLLLLLTLPKQALAQRLVKYTFFIYLYHVLFTACGRMIFMKFGITDVSLLVLLNTVLGVVGPIVLFLILQQNALTKRLLLGVYQ